MAHQLVFSGSVRAELTDSPKLSDAIIARDTFRKFDLKGRTLFVDGSFLAIIEGKEANLYAALDSAKQNRELSNLTVLLKRETAAPEFDKIRLGFSNVDFSEDIQEAFLLSSETVFQNMPHPPSRDMKVMIQTFLKVNNLIPAAA